MKRKTKSILLTMLAIPTLVILCVGLWQEEILVVPEKQIVTADAEMYPLQAVEIKQVWKHYSYESQEHQEKLQTNEQGRVTIPARKIKISMLRKYLYPIWHFFPFGVHVGWGAHETYFYVNVENTGTKANDNKVIVQPIEILYQRHKRQGW